MKVSRELLGQDRSFKDYLNKICDVFNVDIEITPTGDGAENHHRDQKAVLRSSSLMLDGEITAYLNIYSKDHGGGEIDPKELDTIEKLVVNKLPDTHEITGMKCELPEDYNEIHLYQKLGEQILQPESAAESYDIILCAAESMLNANKLSIMFIDEEKRTIRPVAGRDRGESASLADGDYLPCDMYLEKISRGMKPVIFPENHQCVFHSLKGGTDITFSGPVLAAPIIQRGSKGTNRVAGFIMAMEPDSRSGGFNLHHINTIITLASYAAIVRKHFDSLETTRVAKSEIDNMLKDLLSTFESLQQHTALIEHVNQVSVSVNSTLDLKAIFDSIAEYSRNLLMCEAAVVGVMTGRQVVSFNNMVGVPEGRVDRDMNLNELPIIKRSFSEAHSIIVNYYDKSKGERLGLRLPIDIRNFIVYPIVSKNIVSAVIIAINKKDGHDDIFTATDAELLKTLAGQAANAIENGRLLKNITETQMDMMTKMAALAEKRDPETGEHLLRMQKFSRIISQELAKTDIYKSIIDERFINDIYVASPLHDIGKVGITDNILLKPGKLTSEEFDIMKTHTTIGAEILRGPSYLEMAVEIAYNHHERWNGSGYPRGLRGEEIPLSSRIVAVADVYDALTSRRVYKEGFSNEVALDTITNGKGTDFDPMVLEAFFNAQESVNQIKNLIR